MNRKLFTQMRNEWKSNVGLAVELFIVSVVLWFIADTLYGSLVYKVEPTGSDIEHVYQLKVDFLENTHPRYVESSSRADEMRELLARLRRHPGIEAAAVARMGASPYSHSGSWSGVNILVAPGDTAYFGANGNLSIRLATISPEFPRVFRMRGVRGETPEQLGEILARGEVIAGVNLSTSVDSAHAGINALDIIGKDYLQYRYDGSMKHLRLGALVNDVKRSDYDPLAVSGYFAMPMQESDDDQMDGYNEILIRVTDAADGKEFVKNFRENMATEFSIGNLYVNDLVSMGAVRHSYLAEKDKIIMRLILVMGFLLVNVFLGLLGTFWFRTRRRTSEIAVRMVNGATRGSIFRRLVSEGMSLLLLVTPLAILTDWLIRHNNLVISNEHDYFSYGRLWFCIGVVFALMALMIVAGTCLPALAATKIKPAIALHDE